MNTSKAAVVASAVLGKIASIVGYALGIMSLLVICVGLSDMDSDGAVAGMIILLFLLAFSVFSIVKGSQIKRRIIRFKRYVSLISVQNMASLDQIAASTSQSVDFVRDDLQKMIYKKFFANASIDASANEINIGNRTAASSASASIPQQAQPSAQSEMEMFTCSGCGASGTKPKGVPGSCEYCGSIVQ